MLSSQFTTALFFRWSPDRGAELGKIGAVFRSERHLGEGVDCSFPPSDMICICPRQLVFEFREFLVQERRLSARSVQAALQGVMQGAKFVHHSKSKVGPRR